MIPNFFVIGAARSGTTSLCDLLGQHPDVFMCKLKEPRYFNLPQSEYEAKWEWYSGLFRDAGEATAIGEGSQVYTARPHVGDWLVPKRIFDKAPHARFIYVVRHPLERIVSMWTLFAKDNREEATNFNEDVLHPEHRRWYVDRSRYWFQISAFREYFPDDRFLIQFFKEFKQSPLETLHRCTRFLGLDDFHGYRGLREPRNAVPVEERPTRVLDFIKSIPGYQRVRERLPGSIASTLRQSALFHRRIDNKPTWDPEVRSRVIDWIRPDVETFLEFYGKPKDYWSWD